MSKKLSLIQALLVAHVVASYAVWVLVGLLSLLGPIRHASQADPFWFIIPLIIAPFSIFLMLFGLGYNGRPPALDAAVVLWLLYLAVAALYFIYSRRASRGG